MEPIKNNLEPIEESDLDMEGKIRRGFNNSEIKEGAPVAKIEREVSREVNASENDSAYNKILAKIQTQTDDNIINQDDVVGDAQAGAKKTDAESQVRHLVDIAQQKGVIHAVKVARHMEDNYVLDTFHDRLLADEFHDALVKKGMIKEL